MVRGLLTRGATQRDWLEIAPCSAKRQPKSAHCELSFCSSTKKDAKSQRQRTIDTKHRLTSRRSQCVVGFQFQPPVEYQAPSTDGRHAIFSCWPGSSSWCKTTSHTQLAALASASYPITCSFLVHHTAQSGPAYVCKKRNNLKVIELQQYLFYVGSYVLPHTILYKSSSLVRLCMV